VERVQFMKTFSEIKTSRSASRLEACSTCERVPVVPAKNLFGLGNRE
jgi:hypothetical protein